MHCLNGSFDAALCVGEWQKGDGSQALSERCFHTDIYNTLYVRRNIFWVLIVGSTITYISTYSAPTLAPLRE